MIPFKYSRKKIVNKKDANGNFIPLVVKKEDGTEEVVPGKFETEEVWKTDRINLSLFIRTHELDDDRVIILLADGHEEEQRVPVGLKNPKKGMVPGNIVEQKQTLWVQSEIILEKKEDIERLYSILDELEPTNISIN